MAKDFELSKNEISQHLAWLNTFFEKLAILKCRNNCNFPGNAFYYLNLTVQLKLPHVTAHFTAHFTARVTVEISYFVKILTCYHMLLLLFIKKYIYFFIKSSSNMW